VPPTSANVLGVLSLVFWSLVIIISIKYLVFILRADNRGEGGILALLALVRRRPGARTERYALIVLGLFGAALLYGDGMITPAISVLSAVEGLSVATPFFTPYVLPITVGILILLFFFQKQGTGGVGKVFGPVMVIWFFTIGALGLASIFRDPAVLQAIWPWHGVEFFHRNGWAGFLVLGSVFLVVTGGEALYADMGHFGKTPIRLAWFSLVLPALLFNYFGQGSLLLRDPEHAVNPFYLLAPEWALYPMVALSTAAAIIASQAVISGAFSLTRQAVLLGYSPRVDIRHTSESEIGQIYVPSVNWILMVACIWLVLEFGTSSSLAAAYGVAVTATMAITTILFYFVAREHWKWPLWATLFVTAAFLTMDLSFFGANMVKVIDGGWFPLGLAVIIFTFMTTWKTGRRILTERISSSDLPVDFFLDNISRKPPIRVPGTAVYLYRNPDGIPPALLHNLKHNKVLHERVAFVTMIFEEVPFVSEKERASVTPLGNGIFRVLIHYGFKESPDLPRVLQSLQEEGLNFRPMETTYFLGKETLIITKHPGMAIWREELFARMLRNERSIASFFCLPPNRVVELGAQIEM
jgi:KUP system potassium uptake protein